MKLSYYLSVGIAAALIIGAVTAVRQNQKKKKIHRVLVYEEPAQKSEDTAAKTSNTESEVQSAASPEEIEASSAHLKDLTEAMLKESHNKQFSKRYRPKDFVFDAEQSKMASYLKSLPADSKALAREKRRLKILSSVKSALSAYFAAGGYQGPVKLAGSSSALTGTSISMANANVVILQTSSGTREVTWDKISPETVAQILTNLGARRKSVARGFGESQEQHDAQVADEFLLAAVFCDWYGYYKQAVMLVGRAVEANPEISVFAEKIFLD